MDAREREREVNGSRGLFGVNVACSCIHTSSEYQIGRGDGESEKYPGSSFFSLSRIQYEYEYHARFQYRIKVVGIIHTHTHNKKGLPFPAQFWQQPEPTTLPYLTLLLPKRNTYIHTYIHHP